MALSSASPCGPLTLPRLSLVFALLCVLYLVRDVWMPPSPTRALSQEIEPPTGYEDPKIKDGQNDHYRDVCSDAPGAEKVMVILKTGATEIYSKLPTQLVTLFRCTPHYLIFSDLAQTFSDYTIHDALATVQPSYRDHHEDFELYRRLQKYHREGQNPGKLKGTKGWRLDKWKFMPMLHETSRMAPAEVEWFVYIEADTSLSWPNLLQWLGTLNPKDALYMGAQNVIGDTTFAHGGSGFIISRTAAQRVEDRREKEGLEMYDERWESLTSMSCCGDEIIARALVEVDVPLTPSWPRIQGETVSTLDWTSKIWCAPAVTWHHVSPAEVDSMWHFQMQWVKDNGWSAEYLYKDVFDSFVTRHISVNRTFWNNLSKDKQIVKPGSDRGDLPGALDFSQLPKVERQSVESFDDCSRACQADQDCIQWMWVPNRCHMGRDVRFGDTDDDYEDDHEHWSSGWLLERVADMRADLEPCSMKRSS